MGPEPITMAVLTSSRLAIAPPPARGIRPLDLRHEISEDVLVVPRSGPCLRVVLDGEDWQLAMGHPFHRAIVQVHVGDLELRFRKGIRIDRVAVILRRDVDTPAAEVLHRLIAAAVPELQLEGLPAEREGQKLVPEADSEEGNASRKLPGRSHGCPEDVRMSGVPRADRKSTRLNSSHS